MRISDWSSDVCSSDLRRVACDPRPAHAVVCKAVGLADRGLCAVADRPHSRFRAAAGADRRFDHSSRWYMGVREAGARRTVCRASEDGGNRIAAADQPGRCGVDRRHLGGRAWAGGLLCVELALLVAAPVGGDWMNESVVRHDWDKAEVLAMFARPFADLMFDAQTVHRQHFDANAVQKAQLLSIKTGGCAENCGYCSQSASFKTGLKAEKLMAVDAVIEAAREARAGDRKSTRLN